jgi:hypothetical protein
MGDLQAAFDQQFLDITIGKGISKIPAHGTENDLWCEVPPLEDRRSVRLSHDLSSIAMLSWRFLQQIRKIQSPTALASLSEHPRIVAEQLHSRESDSPVVRVGRIDKTVVFSWTQH